MPILPRFLFWTCTIKEDSCAVPVSSVSSLDEVSYKMIVCYPTNGPLKIWHSFLLWLSSESPVDSTVFTCALRDHFCPYSPAITVNVPILGPWLLSASHSYICTQFYWQCNLMPQTRTLLSAVSLARICPVPLAWPRLSAAGEGLAQATYHTDGAALASNLRRSLYDTHVLTCEAW